MGVYKLCTLSMVRMFPSFLFPPYIKRTLFSGGKEFEEVELNHLDGHKGSRPVRIGNGAIDHVQLVRLLKKIFSLDLNRGTAEGYLRRVVSYTTPLSTPWLCQLAELLTIFFVGL
jgi:GH15 family glucan-1,4-alpha-glucosidase